MKTVGTGALLSLCIALGAPYGNMAICGSYMAINFSTASAIFLFFILVGLLNLLDLLVGLLSLLAGLLGLLADFVRCGRCMIFLIF